MFCTDSSDTLSSGLAAVRSRGPVWDLRTPGHSTGTLTHFQSFHILPVSPHPSDRSQSSLSDSGATTRYDQSYRSKNTGSSVVPTPEVRVRIRPRPPVRTSPTLQSFFEDDKDLEVFATPNGWIEDTSTNKA